MEKNLIDIHCHTAGIGAGNSGCFISSKMRKSFKYRFYLKAFGVTEQELNLHGDRLILKRLSESLAQSRHVSKAVVLAMDGVVDQNGELDRHRTEMFIPNEFLAQELKKYDNLLFGASINPYRRNAIELLEQAVANGAVLIKWLPSIQYIDPADPKLIPFYRRMQQLGIPLLTHTGNEESFTWARNELADPERLRLPLSLGVTVIAAHAASNGHNGGEANFVRFTRLCNEYPNLYADISALTQVNRLGHLSRVSGHEVLGQRMLYGTDMPLIKTAVTWPLFHAYRISPLKLRRIMREKNPWDRDVMLKEALGVTKGMMGGNDWLDGNDGFRIPSPLVGEG